MLKSHSSAGKKTGSDCKESSSIPNLMSPCPHLDVLIGGVLVPCLIDTGSMVSTITESCFIQHFEPWGQERLRSCSWLQLRAANGLSIPYIGYMELDIDLCGRIVPRCGVLVVRDPPGGIRCRVPGVLGMNVLGRRYQELFGQHGPALFDFPPVSSVPLSIFQALQHCHQGSEQPSAECTTKVRVRGPRACRVTGGTLKLVAATCAEHLAGITALFEPTESGLPEGLLASPALVRVTGGSV